MSTVEELARDYAEAHPKRDGGSWAGWCASLMFRFNDGAVAYEKATYAGEATEIISNIASAAPINAVHYWSGGSQNNGHCAQDLRGAGTYLFMASSHISEAWGDAIGVASWNEYQDATSGVGLTYMGWGLSYGANPVIHTDDSGSTAGSDTKPINNSTVKDDDMPIFVQHLTTNKTAKGTPLSNAVSAISIAGIIKFSADKWNKKGGSKTAGGPDAANAYGGLKSVSDEALSRILDANHIPWSVYEKAADNPDKFQSV